MNIFNLKPIGIIRSEIKNRKDAPRFYTEGAPDAVVEVYAEYLEGLEKIKAGDEIIIITWLHLGNRNILRVHPRGDKIRPLTGVFLTRSPDRPNPLGLHRARILEINEGNLHINAIEAIDGTPVVDIKCVSDPVDN